VTSHRASDRQGGRPPLRVVPSEAVLEAKGLGVRAGARDILQSVDLTVPDAGVYGIIGPSGVGKSTLLRCLNRLIDLDEGLVVSGEVRCRGRSVRDPEVDPDELRRDIGMLFQQPVVFPGSVLDNVAFGLRRLFRVTRSELLSRSEAALRRAALWDEVKDRLNEPAAPLSVGQRQRLSLARALAVEPSILLMDEPTSALDPRATEAIEELILELRRDHVIVLVTHDLRQARRVSDTVACLCLQDGAGELAEVASCESLFAAPQTRAASEFLSTQHSHGG